MLALQLFPCFSLLATLMSAMNGFIIPGVIECMKEN